MINFSNVLKIAGLMISFSLTSFTSLQAAPGGASAVAKGHGKAVSAAAKDPARVKGAGGVSASAKGHGKIVSESRKAPAPVAPAAP